MSILGGYLKTFLVFLCISIETQHRDKIPQLGLITVYPPLQPPHGKHQHRLIPQKILQTAVDFR